MGTTGHVETNAFALDAEIERSQDTAIDAAVAVDVEGVVGVVVSVQLDEGVDARSVVAAPHREVQGVFVREPVLGHANLGREPRVFSEAEDRPGVREQDLCPVFGWHPIEVGRAPEVDAVEDWEASPDHSQGLHRFPGEIVGLGQGRGGEEKSEENR